MATSLAAESCRALIPLHQGQSLKVGNQSFQKLPVRLFGPRQTVNQAALQKRCCIQATQDGATSADRTPPQSRRALLQGLAGVAVVGASGTLWQTAAAESGGNPEFLPFTDSDGKFGLSIPSDWAQGEGRASNQRRVVAFYKEGDTDTNVNIVITPLSADYTKMGSFGSAESFGETLVNGLDRSWTKPKGPVATLVDARTKNGRYLVEYTFQAPGQMKRHLISSVGMGFDGTYNRLYTVTAQAREDEFAQYQGILNKVLSSFELKFKSPVY